MLEDFFVTSPWSDGRSLIARWTWSYDADLHYFEKASVSNIFSYASYLLPLQKNEQKFGPTESLL